MGDAGSDRSDLARAQHSFGDEIKPSEPIPVLIGAPDEKLREVFSANTNQISRLVRASEVSISEKLDAPRASARAVLVGGAEVAVPLEGLIDFEQEQQRLD